MGAPTIPNESDRTATLAVASAVFRAVEDDEEGPLALPEFGSVKNFDRKIDLLKSWWRDTDLQIFRLSQDLLDTRAALEIACALLAKGGGGQTAADSAVIAARLRALDLPSQEELDLFTAAGSAPIPASEGDAGTSE